MSISRFTPKMIRTTIMVLAFCAGTTTLFAQNDTTRVLFIGNSYTGYNNLAGMVEQLSASAGYPIITMSHTPGGTRLMHHAQSQQVEDLIEMEAWDYVVLQAQSQEPSWPINQVQTEVFPYAQQLASKIRDNNACSMPTFFMTWGRENGDASNCANWPPVCTYEGMDSLLNERYQQMSDDNNGVTAAVGAVWRYLRDNNSQVDLYASDGSHPSIYGSYAAACTFFTTFTQQSAMMITDEMGLDPAPLMAIRQAVDAVVFNDMANYNIGIYGPIADFEVDSVSGYQVTFSIEEGRYDSVLWSFANDADTSHTATHTFDASDVIDDSVFVELIVYSCGESDTTNAMVYVEGTSNVLFEDSSRELTIYPNPTSGNIYIESDEIPSQLSLWSMQGQRINLPAGQKVDLSGIAPGTYILEAEVYGETRSTRLIILERL